MAAAKRRTERIFLPYLGHSTNEYTRGKQQWLYRAEKQQTEKAALVAGIPKIAQFTAPVVIAMTPQLGKRRRTFDASNHSMSAKIIEDVLVRFGVLKDDSAEYVKAVIHVAPERAKDGIEGVNIVIAETSCAPVLSDQGELDLPPAIEIPF